MRPDETYIETTDEPRCDFCAARPPVVVWVLPDKVRGTREALVIDEAKDESVRLTIGDSDGLWGACARCDRLIRNARERPSRLPALVAACARADAAMRQVPRDLAKAYLTDLHGRIVPAFVERREVPAISNPQRIVARGPGEIVDIVRKIRDQMNSEPPAAQENP